MTHNRDRYTALNSSTYKRQRPDDSAHTLDAGPPAKILKTVSGPTRRHEEENMDSKGTGVVSMEPEGVKESIKHSNIIALCPPQSAVQIVNDVLSWNSEEQSLLDSVSVVVADDNATMESYQSGTRSILPISQIRPTAEGEHEVPDLKPSNNAGKHVVFASTEQFLQLSSCGGLTISQNCALIVYDTTKPLAKDRDFLLGKIVDDFYSSNSSSPRPRILVLIRTTQRDDPDITWLKSALNATVLRIVDPGSEEIILRRNPTELIIVYNAPTYTQETLLCQKLREYDTKTLYFARHLRNASLALHDLGPCAADLVWRNALGVFDGTREGLYLSELGDDVPEIRAYDLVKHWPFKLPNLDFASRNMNVSHKFIRLVQLLETHQIHGDKFRGIVFVHKRIIAQLLVALFHSLKPRLQFLRPIALTNHRLSSNLKALEQPLRQFSSGQCNLLVATKSYEDIGLPKASVVILFDVFESQVSRAYFRSCAADQESHLVHMVEQDNNIHRRALSQTTFDSKMLLWTDTVGHDSPSSVPPQPLRESSHSYASDSEDDQDPRTVQDPITGSHIRKHQATTSFYRYVARMGLQGGFPKHQQLFEFLSEDGNYNRWRCTIKLAGAPIDGISSAASASRSLARREACYLACQHLQYVGQLDSSLFPHDNPRINEPRDSGMDLWLDSGHERPYMPLLPDFWKYSVSASPVPQFLYPSIVSMCLPGYGPNERAPICILTQAPLPEIPRFQLSHFGEILTLQFRRESPLSLDSRRLELVHQFTVKFCRILMNKPFESSSSSEMGYLFVPLKRSWGPPAEITPNPPPSNLPEYIDWNMVSLVSETWAVSFADLTSLGKEIEDVVVQDRAVEFTHRCEIVRIREDMTPLSEIDDKPQGYSLLKYTAFAADERFSQGGRTLIEQCHSRRKNFEGLRDPNQPVLEVARMPAATNCLNPRILSQVEPPKKTVQFLIPEYSRKLTVSASTLRMGYLLPSIMRRVDEFLLVKQLNAKFLEHCIRDDLLMMATASPLAGNDYDYERLELLGDAFLKYLSSIYVFAQNPDGTEGELHTARQRYISNQQLCRVTSQLGLPGYIQLRPFNIKTWVPPGMRLADTQKNSTMDVGIERENKFTPQIEPPDQPNGISLIGSGAEKRPNGRKKRPKKSVPLPIIANKTVADVAEAIIGAAYISGGRDIALKATKALMIPFVEVEEWCDFERKVRTSHPNVGYRPVHLGVGSIEKVIGYKFRKPYLLNFTLTHAALNSMEMKDHQRLEFLGDAILDFLVVRYLYNKNQQASPGELSALKSIMVSNSILAAICVWSGLHRFIHATPQLGQIILSYEKALGAQETTETFLARREERRIGHYWRDLDAPKVLSDVVESMIGAAYISDSCSHIGVEAIFDKLLLPFYERYIPPSFPVAPPPPSKNMPV